MRAAIFTIGGLEVGQLSVMARPRGGDWLADEMRALRVARVDVLVSLLTYDEMVELELGDEPTLCIAAGIDFLGLPIPDRAVPADNASVLDLLTRLDNLLRAGKHITFHCRQGIGRSALMTAALLTLHGVTPDDACARIAAVRGRAVPDTAAQREWVLAFAQQSKTLWEIDNEF